jgi:hypothetical protein
MSVRHDASSKHVSRGTIARRLHNKRLHQRLRQRLLNIIGKALLGNIDLGNHRSKHLLLKHTGVLHISRVSDAGNESTKTITNTDRLNPIDTATHVVAIAHAGHLVEPLRATIGQTAFLSAQIGELRLVLTQHAIGAGRVARRRFDLGLGIARLLPPLLQRRLARPHLSRQRRPKRRSSAYLVRLVGRQALELVLALLHVASQPLERLLMLVDASRHVHSLLSQRLCRLLQRIQLLARLIERYARILCVDFCRVQCVDRFLYTQYICTLSKAYHFFGQLASRISSLTLAAASNSRI